MEDNSIEKDNRSESKNPLPFKKQGWYGCRKGEICTIVKSYKGYSIRTDDYRTITRVDKCCVEFIKGQNMVDKTKEAY